jgi:hypothetical protein
MRGTFFRGAFLVYGLIVMFFVSTILTGILMFVSSSTRVSLQMVSRNQAFDVSEAGILWYRWYLSHMVDGRTAQQIQAFWSGGTALGVGTPYIGSYTNSSGVVGHYRITVTPPATGSTIVSAVSEGWMDKSPDQIRSIRVRFRRQSWSEYTVIANADAWFGDTETVIGKVFSNGGVRVDGYATNTVSSAVSTYQNASAGATTPKPGVWSNSPGEISSVYHVPVFQGGKQFPVPTKDFNSIGADLSLMKTDAIAGVNGSRYFDATGSGRHIRLRNDGKFDIATVNVYSKKSGQGTDGSTSLIANQITNYIGGWQMGLTLPSDGVIFVENNVWLEGQINNSRVTIVAANLLGGSRANISIGLNNIRYTNYDGRDNLGIIAQGNIEAIYSSLSTLRIDGALLAQTGRVERSYYGDAGDHKTSIHTYGALATNQQYTWNWCTNAACTPLYGFTNTQAEYDNNLYYAPPPYFPTGTQYLMDLWEEL